MNKKELLKAKIAAMMALINTAKAAGRVFTADEDQQYAALDAEVKALQSQIDADEKQAAREAEIAALHAQYQTPVPVVAAGREQPGGGIIVGHNREADKPWASFGEQLAAVRAAAQPGGTVDPRLTTRAAASGLSESVPSDGGFLVQQDFSVELLKNAYDTGVLASKVQKIPLTTAANGLKINGVDESSRANGSRWGGIQSYWENEADQYTGTKPKFRQIELQLKKLTGLCYATDELLQDAAALETVIRQGFAEEFGFKIDDAIIRGTGAGQPLGILNSSGTVQVAAESGQAADTIKVENIIKMWSRCYGRARQNAAWYINQDIEPQLYTMSLAVGSGGVPVYMPANGVSGSPYSTLFGRPVIPLEQCDTLGNVGDIILGDLSQYVMIDKGSIKSDVSVHVRFVYDEQVFKFVYRADGQPVRNKALTPFKGSNTLSPFVTLAAR
ncbi:phage major capsid protein [Cohnella yongneupensis]|uniref:Phage major capsid protein n=1 Tax=Cohnella yongneupensis TaxID=425006 RepID=A0ABW0QUJ8_9BACL